MKITLFLGAAALALMGGCSPAPDTAAASEKPQIGSFGFDETGMDRATSPGDDFVRFANGKWEDRTEIPADRSSFGMSAVLDEQSRERTRGIIEAAMKQPTDANRKVGDFYASFMDEAGIEKKGAAPVQAELQRIAAIADKGALAAALGESVRIDGPTPFAFYVNQDAKAPDTYIPVFVQSGLGLPDRDYYLVDSNQKYVDTRAKYLAHIARMLTLAGTPAAQAEAKARGIYDLERRMAQVHWTRVDSRDDDKTYNKWARADFTRRAPGFDWNAYFQATGLGTQPAFIVSQPSSFTGMAKLVADVPLDAWKDWLAFHTVAQRAPVLPKAFVDENFGFNGTVLNGQPQNRERWKRGVDATTGALGEAVGQLYVAQYFPPEAKAEADKLVRNVIKAMDARLAALEWMAPETKQKAREKLAAFTPKIGYPDRWRDYSALNIVRGDAYGNAVRAARFEYDRNLAKLGKPIDRGEWFMTPMTVNAYANPTMNEIVFPAAILQPPFFDPKADPAVNYGGIGAVIGHEISHHFDDQGRKYDKTGRLADWWTAQDVARFKTYTDKVVAQYGAYEPLPGQKVNGQLTLGENIADLAGVRVAHDAWLLALGGKPASVIDGFTGDQRFYLGWAQVWRQKIRPENLTVRLATDPHTPGNWRPYVVRNEDAWYTAFDVKPGGRFYLKPEDRIRVW